MFFYKLKERQRLQVEAGLLEKTNLRDDGDFRRTVVESERLEKEYAHYFDSRIVNTDFDQTFQRLLRDFASKYSGCSNFDISIHYWDKIKREINELETKHQWVPTSWVFWKDRTNTADSHPIKLFDILITHFNPSIWYIYYIIVYMKYCIFNYLTAFNRTGPFQPVTSCSLNQGDPYLVITCSARDSISKTELLLFWVFAF